MVAKVQGFYTIVCQTCIKTSEDPRESAHVNIQK